MVKKFLTGMLAVMMLVSAMAVTVFAKEETTKPITQSEWNDVEDEAFCYHLYNSNGELDDFKKGENPRDTNVVSYIKDHYGYIKFPDNSEVHTCWKEYSIEVKEPEDEYSWYQNIIPYDVFMEAVSKHFATTSDLKSCEEYDAEKNAFVFYPSYGKGGGPDIIRMLGNKKISETKYIMFFSQGLYLGDDKEIDFSNPTYYDIIFEYTGKDIDNGDTDYQHKEIKFLEVYQTTKEIAEDCTRYPEGVVPDSEVPEQKPVETIPTEDVKNEIANSSDKKVEVNLSKADTAKKDIFEAAKGKDKEVVFNVVDDSGKTSYAWSFNGKDIKDTTIDVNLELKIDTENKAVADKVGKDNKALVLSFSHSGNLPATASVKVYVGDKYKDGEKLFFYYYNEKTKAMDFQAKDIVVKDGYATVEISHCSDYVLTNNPVKTDATNPSTGDATNVAVVLLIALIAVGGLYVTSKKLKAN